MIREDLPAVLDIEAGANPSPWGAAEFAVFLAAPPGDGPGPRAWVHADPRVMGFLCAAAAADEAELQAIAVASGQRGRGLGSELMRAFLDWARAAGAATAHLEVREGNAGALAFYRRWGFAETGRRPRYYRDNGETALLMARSL
jgi:ribosomal-protein-alanine N-acetyltransferase